MENFIFWDNMLGALGYSAQILITLKFRSETAPSRSSN